MILLFTNGMYCLGEVDENEGTGVFSGYPQVYGGVDQGMLINLATK